MSLKEQKSDFWREFFLKLNFVLNPMLNTDLFNPWYSNGNFHIGFNLKAMDNGFSPLFRVYYHGAPFVIDVRVMDKDGQALWKNDPFETPQVQVKEFKFVIENLIVPEKVPLLVGIDWVKELIVLLLKGRA